MFFLTWMVVDSDKSPLQLAIMFNAKHLNWSTTWKLIWREEFMKAYPEFELKAAIQLIKGKHSTKKELWKSRIKSTWLQLKKLVLCTSFQRSLTLKSGYCSRILLCVWNKIPNIQTYIKRLSPAKSGRERMKICFGKSS